jgi:hypothetical protein
VVHTVQHPHLNSIGYTQPEGVSSYECEKPEYAERYTAEALLAEACAKTVFTQPTTVTLAVPEWYDAFINDPAVAAELKANWGGLVRLHDPNIDSVSEQVQLARRMAGVQDAIDTPGQFVFPYLRGAPSKPQPLGNPADGVIHVVIVSTAGEEWCGESTKVGI